MTTVCLLEFRASINLSTFFFSLWSNSSGIQIYVISGLSSSIFLNTFVLFKFPGSTYIDTSPTAAMAAWYKTGIIHSASSFVVLVGNLLVSAFHIVCVVSEFCLIPSVNFFLVFLLSVTLLLLLTSGTKCSPCTALKPV